eukprot:TRINITY_DN7669_c0_g1_i1.p1 TRINITY_DN7669_c0_g1~~TRINITY_DN7669_c0_g1_i1.p1  ORF type:complete len:251 (-),score=74.48 TRINITY_DN7669_c0_g1_i1:70-744(-)
MIVELAEKSTCLSLRGTCFYVLGLLSSTDYGREILDFLGWESDAQSHICIPKDLKSSGFLSIPAYKYKGSWAIASPDIPPFSPGPPTSISTSSSSSGISSSASPSPNSASSASSPSTSTSGEGNTDLKEEIRTSVINISNHISSENASRTLKKIKTTNPELFVSAPLTMEVYRLMENYFYRLPARRFLYDMFSSTTFTQKDFEESISGNQHPSPPPSARRKKPE